MGISGGPGLTNKVFKVFFYRKVIVWLPEVMAYQIIKHKDKWRHTAFSEEFINICQWYRCQCPSFHNEQTLPIKSSWSVVWAYIEMIIAVIIKTFCTIKRIIFYKYHITGGAKGRNRLAMSTHCESSLGIEGKYVMLYRNITQSGSHWCSRWLFHGNAYIYIIYIINVRRYLFDLNMYLIESDVKPQEITDVIIWDLGNWMKWEFIGGSSPRKYLEVVSCPQMSPSPCPPSFSLLAATMRWEVSVMLWYSVSPKTKNQWSQGS